MIKVSILGTGNVATHLFKAFSKSDEIEIVQVIGRNKKALLALAPEEKITSDFSNLNESDIYIIALSDNSIKTVSELLTHKNKLIVHTSGSTPMNELSRHERHGVFYPLQTFSKSNELDFKKVPICLEAENKEDLVLLKKLANLVSENVYEIHTEQRKSLHLAAVFVNNFTNHLYHMGSEICKENNVRFEILSPLIQETARKIETLSPYEAQTGPARRNDSKTIANQLEQIKKQELKAVYELLSKSIQATYGKEL
ncbi:Rossmann-like and DUF2520 domain-containing protein [Zobellia barbeyronii]|uniref:DUF2520 domain-containing protein n=1 Tax=Zobellia barbeyronii TaxID=2748009 RepID=A0ABS5WBJ6_9FLAO|nr:Rossmann-like and DUF2520 domain-containing protein [Zobellia barbeyronii]MBT2160772.1 DUF2520 domain-containing protein [Zobellia barbeyronii]